MAEETAPEATPAAETPAATEVTPAAAEATAPAAPAEDTAPDPLDNGLGFKEFLAAPNAPDPTPEGADEKPADEKPADEKPAAEADPKAELEARLKETRDYATREAQRAKELERKLAKAEKRLAGDDWDDDDDETTAAPAVEAKVAEAKLGASLAAANAIYGEDAVRKALLDEGAPFGPGGKYAGNEDLRRAIMAAPAPAIRAMEILDEIAFTERWGTKPKTVEDAIRQDERAKLEATIEAEVEKRIRERLATRRESTIAGLSGVRGGGTASKSKGNGVVDRPLGALGNPALS